LKTDFTTPTKQNIKMDESLFFFDDYNTTSTNVPTTNDHTMLTGVLVGFFVGLAVHLVYVCTDRARRKIDELMDEVETLKEAVDDLAEENEDLKLENDRLTVDASASERLIDRLKEEVTVLTNKLNANEYEIAGLESDNYALSAELSHRLNSVLRNRQTQMTPPNRTNTSPVAPPVIRKRQREEL
jgi:regulator of replication initiation timing